VIRRYSSLYPPFGLADWEVFSMSSTIVIQRAARQFSEALASPTRLGYLVVALIAIVLVSPTQAFAQTTSFTYQGRFVDGGTAANGVYDMQFKLFDSSSVGTGNQLGPTITNGAVAVVNGVFTVQLNFGSTAFSGPDRFLELGVRSAGSVDPYTVMSPRQPLTSSVYAVRALSASTADSAINATNATTATNANNSAQLGGVDANQYVVTTDPRLTISGNFIQNSTSQQASSNFNISGNGTVGGVLSGNTVTSGTQYNIGGSRVFTVSGAGSFNNSNTIAGMGAGTSTTPSGSGTNGNSNSFFGWIAGNANTVGFQNAYFGALAGQLIDGSNNSIFGYGAGSQTTAGGNNSFFGVQTGIKTTGGANTFLGGFAGSTNTSGNNNTFVGESAGSGNLTGTNNTLIGFNTSVFSGSLFNATAIGFGASVSADNSLVLGNPNVNVGIGVSAPLEKLHISGDATTRARINAGTNAGVALALGEQTKWSMAATGVGNFQIFNDGISQNAVWIDNNDNFVGLGMTGPGDRLEVNGRIRVDQLGSGGATQLCLNPSFQISTCSSSVRYKKDLQPFTRGLALLNQLKPITFKWKADNSRDLGFSAEDIARVEPMLVTRNDKGEIEGVKYDRLSAVLVNAVKEQQQQIAQQQEQIKLQQSEIRSLKQLVCQRHRRAAICR
jgi:hypothetical protein